MKPTPATTQATWMMRIVRTALGTIVMNSIMTAAMTKQTPASPARRGFHDGCEQGLRSDGTPGCIWLDCCERSGGTLPRTRHFNPEVVVRALDAVRPTADDPPSARLRNLQPVGEAPRIHGLGTPGIWWLGSAELRKEISLRCHQRGEPCWNRACLDLSAPCIGEEREVLLRILRERSRGWSGVH